jgi:hypothetical protein
MGARNGHNLPTITVLDPILLCGLRQVLAVGRHAGEDWLHFYIKSSVRSQNIMMMVDHAMRKRAEAAYLD